MIVRIRFTAFRPVKPQCARLVKFRAILCSALQTRGYAVGLRSAGLGTREAIAELNSVEEALGGLPWTYFSDWRGSAEEFENPHAHVDPAPRFAYPFHPAPGVVFFDGSGFLPALKPDETLAAPARVLREFAGRITRGDAIWPPLEHAMLSLAGPEAGILGARDRDLLWRAFRVPVFEQYLDGDGHVMAGECEAHEGLHVTAQSAIFEVRDGELFLTSLAALRRPAVRLGTGFHAEIDTEVCACGRTGPRLLNLRAVETRRATCAAN